jgi:hypothetical protein
MARCPYHAKFALRWLSTIHTKSRIGKLAVCCIDKRSKGTEAELYEIDGAGRQTLWHVSTVCDTITVACLVLGFISVEFGVFLL